MSEYSSFKLEQQRHVALITLINPPANTWTIDGLKALKQLITDLDADKNIYALVLTGDGEKFFSAGADLKQFQDGDPEKAAKVLHCFSEAFETLAAFRGVSIAAINGITMGGGLEAVLACDIRICSTNAKFGLPEAKVGLLPGAGGTQRLPWVVGEGWAKRMILCGEQINSEKALFIGLVEEVTEQNTVVERAMELAHQVENQSPASVKICKELINGARFKPMANNLPAERDQFLKLFATDGPREGVNAFLEKRKPAWNAS